MKLKRLFLAFLLILGLLIVPACSMEDGYLNPNVGDDQGDAYDGTLDNNTEGTNRDNGYTNGTDGTGTNGTTDRTLDNENMNDLNQ